MKLRYRTTQKTEPRNDAALAVMEWARAAIDLDDDTVVSVTSHQCGEADCAGAGTIILLMHPDQPTLAVKIMKSMDMIGESDVAEALQPLRSRPRAIRVR